MPASVLVVFIVFGLLFVAGAVYLVTVSMRVKKLRDKLDEKGKK
jgi:hypothetical protein